MKALPVLWPLLCVCALHSAGIYLFLSGFLLVRLEVNRTSTCGDVLQPSGEEHGDFCRAQPRFRRAVLLIIDALKMDFARFDPNNTAPRPYENKLPVLEETLSGRPSHSRLYPFRADPPTTTMQRIKGFTTGSLPTFVDVGNNFASSAILEDNLIHQFGQVGESTRDTPPSHTVPGRRVTAQPSCPPRQANAWFSWATTPGRASSPGASTALCPSRRST